MDQATLPRPEPNIQRFTEEETLEMCLEYADLLEAGKIEEANELEKKIPMRWETCNGMKELLGIDALIESGINLSEAVDHYGIEWLER